MRVLQVSDLHYSGKHLAEADRCFSFAVDQAIAAGVDAAVIAGDATDHALELHSPAAAALARNVRRLADHCPVLMLQGTFSHEPPGGVALFRLLGGRYGVHVAERIEQVALLGDGSWCASEGWHFQAPPAGTKALFSCVPTVNKAVVAATVGATRAAEAVGEQLSAVLRGFAPGNRSARAAGIPTIGISHGTVVGCVTEHGVPMAGLDHEFTTGALFAAEANAFMIGHIHKHQFWEENARFIAYAGSIGRLHHGEEGDKGFLLWQFSADRVKFTLVPTPAKRTITIEFDGMPDIEELRECANKAGIEGAFVRVRWTVPEENRRDVDRESIAKLFDGAAEVKLEGRVIPVARARAAGIAQEASITGKVEAWARATGTDAAPLLACLETLQSTSAEEVASVILFGADRAARAVGPADEDGGEDTKHGDGDGAAQGEEAWGETAELF